MAASPQAKAPPRVGTRISGDTEDGFGRYAWPNGEQYEGQFKQGAKHGTGVSQWVDGGRYEGEYRRGEKAGQGAYWWSDGSSYRGAWKGGRREGFGAFVYARDGASWEGLWKGAAGLPHGAGTWRWRDGLEMPGAMGPNQVELGLPEAPARWRAAAEKAAADAGWGGALGQDQ